MAKVQVSKMKIQVGDYFIEVTAEEAEEIYKQLGEKLGKEEKVIYVDRYYPYPGTGYPCFPPTVTWGTGETKTIKWRGWQDDDGSWKLTFS